MCCIADSRTPGANITLISTHATQVDPSPQSGPNSVLSCYQGIVFQQFGEVWS